MGTYIIAIFDFFMSPVFPNIQNNIVKENNWV